MKRLMQFAILAVCLVCAATSATAAEWHVGPEGKPDNAGTKQAPWDIASTLLGARNVKPGDTVFLSGGTYRRRPDEKFAVRLRGEQGA